MNREYRARVAALSVLQASACAKLLRAHGRAAHADHLEAAVDEVTKIVTRHLGQDVVSLAMAWAIEKIGDPANAHASSDRKRTLH
jgi:2-hydroxychromene-2-carboxylate isomerase